MKIKEIAVRIYLRITKGSAAELRTQAYKALKIGISLTVSRIIEKGEFIRLCRLSKRSVDLSAFGGCRDAVPCLARR